MDEPLSQDHTEGETVCVVLPGGEIPQNQISSPRRKIVYVPSFNFCALKIFALKILLTQRIWVHHDYRFPLSLENLKVLPTGKECLHIEIGTGHAFSSKQVDGIHFCSL